MTQNSVGMSVVSNYDRWKRFNPGGLAESIAKTQSDADAAATTTTMAAAIEVEATSTETEGNAVPTTIAATSAEGIQPGSENAGKSKNCAS